MQNAYSIIVPADPNSRLNKIQFPKSAEDINSQKFPYQEAVGSLLFAARDSRPDIEYAVNQASKYSTNFVYKHCLALKRIFRYLIDTVDLGIVYEGKNSNLNLMGFTDADYAGCLDTRKSTSGFVFTLNGGPVT